MIAIRLLQADPPLADPAVDLAFAHAMVNRTRSPSGPSLLRVARPSRPSVVFGRRDARLPGFGAAVAAARHQGFTPLIRSTGGRAVAYTDQAIVIDHASHDPHATGEHDARFTRFGQRYVQVLTDLGIPAQLGAVPGEYCPGAHSVNARGQVKLVGTSQRVVTGAWLFSSLVVLGDTARLRPVLSDVYGALGQPFDPASVGSILDEHPRVDLEQLASRLVLAHTDGQPPNPSPPDADLVAAAHTLADRHRC